MMQVFSYRIYILIVFIVSFNSTKAQKNIVISDSLTANAEPLSVKMKQGLGKWKVFFGDFGVVTSKSGWTSTQGKGNFWGTSSESSSKTKFSFVLSNNSSDTATVNAANYTKEELLHQIKIFDFFPIGSDQVKLWYKNFAALITINGDTTDTWTLLVNGAAGLDTVATQEAYLVNSNRKILVVPVTSANTKNRVATAHGYEFFEDGQSVGAVQYYGGGLFGFGNMIIWIDKRLDPKTKLVLAAAMAATIKLKLTEF